MDRIDTIKERVYHAPLVMAKFGTDGYVSVALDYAKDCQFLLDQIESLQHDKAALIEVLEWYGDDDNWTYTKYGIPAEDDYGMRAKAILTKIKR